MKMYIITYRTDNPGNWEVFVNMMATIQCALNLTYNEWMRLCQIKLQEQYNATLEDSYKAGETRIIFKDIEDVTAFKLKFGA